MRVLRPCESIWGAADRRSGEPSIVVEKNAIFVPWRPQFFLDDPYWGVYNSAGQLLEIASYNRLPSKYRMGQMGVPETTKTNNIEFLSGRFLYGGPVILHYGHFITAMLPRLWHLIKEPLQKGEKIICHCTDDPSSWFSINFVAEILGALNLSPGDFVVVPYTVKVEELKICGVALEEQSYFYDQFRELCSHIGRKTLRTEKKDIGAIYLSKTKLGSANSRLKNEEEIQKIMAAKGFRIFHPQEMSFSNQLRMFYRSTVVLGSMTSAFHTSAFLPEPDNIIGLSPTREVNANFAIIDTLKHNDSKYYYPYPGLDAIASDSTATFLHEIRDARAIANDLIMLIEQKRG